MINFWKKSAFLALTAALVVSISNLSHPSQALSNGGSITALGVSLTENFDGLSAGGTWTDNSTVPGWYSSRTTYVLGTGSSNTGALYSFGVAGTNPATDRALGSVASGGTGTVYQAVRLVNNTGSTITSLDISYLGEQWRNGGNTTAHTLTFQYQVANAGTITGANTPTAGWTTFSPLSFTGPVALASAAALDGNAPGNRIQRSANLPVTVSAGQEIWLRWQDPDDSGNDHGLAIDDFSVTANGAVSGTPPSVASATPAGGATSVGVNTSLSITFSRAVNADPGAFSLSCGGSIAVAPSASPATTFTLSHPDLPAATACTLTVSKDAISAVDTSEHMSADANVSFTTDAPPAISSTSPGNLAANVAASSNITINFTEPITAPGNAFSLTCGTTSPSFGVTVTGSTVTLNPDSDLPFSTTCSVSILGALISDTDLGDPPDHMADAAFSFTVEARPVAANVIINEVDADTPGDDRAEFVELYSSGVPHQSLDGLVLVFYDGGTSTAAVNKVYAAFDLTGKETDDNGYFVIGNPAVTTDSLTSMTFEPGEFGLLQNGADAVALYAGSISSFPIGSPAGNANTPLPLTGLRDAFVYDTDDADNNVLRALLNANQPQVNENASGDSQNQSSQRCTNGSGGARNTTTYLPFTPTPGAANQCPAARPASDVVISQIYGGGGNTGSAYHNDFIELFNRGTQPVDLGGWSVQYNSPTGSTWDLNVQPLGGLIAPNEYFLIALGAGTVGDGAALPAANIVGAINMGNAAGKVALVDNFDPLPGGCPIFNTHVKDFVGYGTTADCFEGSTRAPAPSNTTSISRKNPLAPDPGVVDTDNNGTDFAAAAAPNPRRTSPIIEIGPFVFRTDPSAHEFEAPRDPTIVVTFTEAVTVVDPWLTIECSATGAHDSFTQAGGGTTFDVTPNVTMQPGETCTVTVLKDQVHDQDADDSNPDTDTLRANYSWSFTVATGAPPPDAPAVHLTMGNPSNATADTGNADNYLMEKPEFALSYNRDLGRPNWVSWHLTDEWTGNLSRDDSFRPDPAVPADWYRVQSFDFSGSGFDRGHMTPNADRNNPNSVPSNQATFLMSNMIAQAPGNNQGPWAAMESELRTLLPANELYIVSGPAGSGGIGSLQPPATTFTVADGHVSVPSQTWKVVLVLPKLSGDDISRVTCSARTIAAIMPNDDSIRNSDWHSYITTVDAVEALTGYDFFSSLPAGVQYCIEAGTNGTNPPADTEAPVVTCGSADGNWHADDVAVSCTATDSGGSGLLTASDASFTLTTAIPNGSEDANASTNSRAICDRAGNCTTAGPIVGNKIDRKDPAISLITPANGATFEIHSNAMAQYSCTDGGSGVQACNGSVANGAAIDTATLGDHTFSIAATDAAGHTSTTFITYTVRDTIAPTTAIASPVNGARYQVNHVVTASYACGDIGSGIATCAGNVGNGAAIDTASAGAKTFTVTATDAAGNTSTTSVSYTVASNAISVSNVPTTLQLRQDSFVPAFSYAGDGVTSVTSLTTKQCTVENGVVMFQKKGTCTIVAHATASQNFDAAQGAPQSFEIDPHKLRQ